MIDLQQALEKLLFDRLTAQVSLARVFQHVPQDTAPPVVIIADMTVSNVGDKISRLDRFEFDIVALIRSDERKPLNAVQTQVRSALDTWRPATAGGVLCGQIGFVSGDGYLLPDEAIYYGTQRFACFVQEEV